MRSKAKPAPADPEARYKVPVVCSTFRILEELSHAGAMGLNEVTERSGVAKSTVFRILTTLRLLGYVVRDGRKNYYVSHSLADLVSDVASSESLKRAALPHMLGLRDQFGETVNLGQLRLDKVVYLEVAPSEHALRLHERVGSTVDAHATALGKAILAFSPPEVAESLIADRELAMLTRRTITGWEEFRAELRRVRERGFAFDRGETSLLATCVGAPILDAHGNALAAVSISGPSSRFNPKKDSPAVEGLLAAAAEISKQFRKAPV